MGYSLINLKDMINELGEEETNNILSSYLCPINKDVEYFLRDKAVEFAKQGIAATHLVFTSYKNSTVLVGYFALANKFTSIPKRLLRAIKQKLPKTSPQIWNITRKRVRYRLASNCSIR